MSKIPVKPTSRQDIWSFVRKVRCVFGVESKLYFDIVGFVERVLPEIFPDFVLEICPEVEMGNRHGLSMLRLHMEQITRGLRTLHCLHLPVSTSL